MASREKIDFEWDARATWIWHPSYDDSRNPGSIVLFRREFTLDKIPPTLTIAVTADTRYRLFLNGNSVSVGPCKGEVNYWYYETVDVTAFAHTGTNVLAAEVLRYSPMHRGNTPVNRSRKPGFIMIMTGEQVRLLANPNMHFERCVSLARRRPNYPSFMSLLLILRHQIVRAIQ
jgi:hypothetical protein